jgi:hypothetical protein
MKKILTIILFILILYLTYIYWKKYIVVNKSSYKQSLYIIYNLISNIRSKTISKYNEIFKCNNNKYFLTKNTLYIDKEIKDTTKDTTNDTNNDTIMNTTKDTTRDSESNLYIKNENIDSDLNFNQVITYSEDNYQLTDSVLNQFENIFNEYIQSKNK